MNTYGKDVYLHQECISNIQSCPYQKSGNEIKKVNKDIK